MTKTMKPAGAFAIGQALAAAVALSAVMVALSATPSLRQWGGLVEAAVLVSSAAVGAGTAARIVGALAWRSDLGWYAAVLLTRCLAIPLSAGAWIVLAYTVRTPLFVLFPDLAWRVDPRDPVVVGVEFLVASLILIGGGIPLWCTASAIAERLWSRRYRSGE